MKKILDVQLYKALAPNYNRDRFVDKLHLKYNIMLSDDYVSDEVTLEYINNNPTFIRNFENFVDVGHRAFCLEDGKIYIYRGPKEFTIAPDEPKIDNSEFGVEFDPIIGYWRLYKEDLSDFTDTEGIIPSDLSDLEDESGILSGFAAVGHTHDEYALATHTHTLYAASGHTHTLYANKEHTHSIDDITGLEDFTSGVGDVLVKSSSAGNYTTIVTEGTAKLDLSGINSDIDELMKEVFPLILTKGSGGKEGTYEVNSTATPSENWTIERKGVDVSSDATVVVTKSQTGKSDTTITSEKTSFTDSAISGNTTYKVTATLGELSESISYTYKFAYKRFYGEISSIPTDVAATAKTLTSDFSSPTTTIENKLVKKNKGYLCAVQGSVNFVVESNGGTVELKSSDFGTCTINGATYSYVIVPISEVDWTIKKITITNKA